MPKRRLTAASSRFPFGSFERFFSKRRTPSLTAAHQSLPFFFPVRSRSVQRGAGLEARPTICLDLHVDEATPMLLAPVLFPMRSRLRQTQLLLANASASRIRGVAGALLDCESVLRKPHFPERCPRESFPQRIPRLLVEGVNGPIADTPAAVTLHPFQRITLPPSDGIGVGSHDSRIQYFRKYLFLESWYVIPIRCVSKVPSQEPTVEGMSARAGDLRKRLESKRRLK